MTLTKKMVAAQIAAYRHPELSVAELVAWAEPALMDGDLAAREAGAIAPVIARLGVADVRAFGLTWADWEALLPQPGYPPRVDVVEA